MPMKSWLRVTLTVNEYIQVHISMAISCTVFDLFHIEEYCDLEIQVRGHSPGEFMLDLYITEIYRSQAILKVYSGQKNELAKTIFAV